MDEYKLCSADDTSRLFAKWETAGSSLFVSLRLSEKPVFELMCSAKVADGGLSLSFSRANAVSGTLILPLQNTECRYVNIAEAALAIRAQHAAIVCCIELKFPFYHGDQCVIAEIADGTFIAAP